MGAFKNIIPESARYTKVSWLLNVAMVKRMPTLALLQPSTISSQMMSDMVHNGVEQFPLVFDAEY